MRVCLFLPSRRQIGMWVELVCGLLLVPLAQVLNETTFLFKPETHCSHDRHIVHNMMKRQF